MIIKKSTKKASKIHSLMNVQQLNIKKKSKLCKLNGFVFQFIYVVLESRAIFW